MANGCWMNRLAQFAQAVVFLALASLATVPAHADGTTVVPISGTASYNYQWNFSLSGPSLSLDGGTLLDGSIFTTCTPGTLCDLSGTMQNGSSCNIILCGGSFNGQSYPNWLIGTLTFAGAAVAPFPLSSSPNSFVLTAPATVYGQLFAVDCPTYTNCNSAPEVFGFNIVGTGTVTANGSTQFLNQDAIFEVQYSFVGVASEAPEPPGWLLALSGIGILAWIARKRQLLRKASLGCNAF